MPDWGGIRERLAGRRRSDLSAAELDLLADALFWVDDPHESSAVRRDAYQRHAADGSTGEAALAAWRLYYDHVLVGETAVAGGWLERARRHAAAAGDVIQGWLHVAEADWAAFAGDLASAVDHADRALAAGRQGDDPALVAMALQTKGRLLVALDRPSEGIGLLDEAMALIITDDLDPLFTGWVYCNVLSTCHDLADLHRAAQWSDAAARWCDDVADGGLYPGLCRIHAAELSCLRGAWPAAEAEARRACAELTAHDARYAGEAFYLAGELRRLVGDLEGAQEAFTRAHELGRVPQPGLALVRLAQGRAPAAARTLRLTLEGGAVSPLQRTQLLRALVDAELHAGDPAAARRAADELNTVARSSTSPYLHAVAAWTDGDVLLADGEPVAALAPLGTACSAFQELGLPYETARVRTSVALAARRAGDGDTADLELRAAQKTFDELGAGADAERVRSLLHGPDARAQLSGREVEVLRLVAQGSTNREIGEALFISEHTVARHLSNIFAKLGVTSRAAATAYGYEHELIT